MSTMPIQKPGRSEQIVCTPPIFLDALRNRLGIERFDIDLAASSDNAVAEVYYTEADDALVQPWTGSGWGFCNPPFGDIEPWVCKAWTESCKGANIAMLLPASVGSNYWKSYIDQKAYVLFLSPRLTFVGHKHPYPKDLALLLYNAFGGTGYACWRWA